VDEFENTIIKGIHCSRYIASWHKTKMPIAHASRGYNDSTIFIEWLRTLVINGEKLSEDEIWRIQKFATNGKLELEANARAFCESKGS